MILIMGISLYTSRIVLNTLGVKDYGTFNVVGGVVTMFGFFNGAMASATQRFLSYEIGRKDYIQLRKTFNATQIIHIGIALIIFSFAEIVGLWFVNNQLNLPDGRMEAARWVYHFSVLSFMVSIIQVPYNAVILARERMSVYAYVSILEVLLKLLIVFMLTWIAFDKLKLYGILLLVVSVVIAVVYRIYVLKHFAEARFKFIKDKTLYKTLISYSGWNLFGGIAMVAKNQGISIILNIFFGTVVNAAQGIANQVYGAINSFVANFQMASNPQIVKSYAATDNEYMTNLIIRTSKFSFYLLFILTLPVLLEIDFILKLWLKIVPKYTSIFTILILINAWVDSISGPLITAVQATGKIKTYQIFVGIIFMLNLPVSYLLFKMGFSPVSTFIVNVCVTSIAFVFRIFFTKMQIQDFPVSRFLKEVIIRNIPVILLSALIPWIIKSNMHSGIIRLMLVTIVSLIASLIVVYLIGLINNEKLFVKKTLFDVLLKIEKWKLR